MREMTPQEAVRLLQWYVDAGVDECLQDEPRDYFAQNIAAQSVPLTGAPQQDAPYQSHIATQHSHQPLSGSISLRPPLASLAVAAGASTLHHTPSAAIAEARALADSATTLAELEAAVRGFEGCAVKRTAMKTVFADGNPGAKLMLIGEAPGAQEDVQGIPFCGPSGQLLDRMLAAIGYSRKENAYITNSFFWRPPGNRTPSTEELAMCQPFVERHVALIDPALIVLVGGTATKAILGMEGITRMRGKSYSYQTPYNEKTYPVQVIFHPSYLLRAPVHKRITWLDLLNIKQKMADLTG